MVPLHLAYLAHCPVRPHDSWASSVALERSVSSVTVYWPVLVSWHSRSSGQSEEEMCVALSPILI